MPRSLFPGKFIVFLAFAALAASALAADDFPPITEQERTLTTVPGQPGAPAVVLFSKAELRIMDYPKDVSSSLEVVVRIKILTEEGKEYGDVAIEHSRFRRLNSFAGRTVGPDGRIVPLPEDAVFEEESSRSRKWYVTKAAFPAVEVGAIIDYRYTLRWDSIYRLAPWLFHNEIPTQFSEITYHVPRDMGVATWSRQTTSRPLQAESGRSSYGKTLRVWLEGLRGIPDEPFSFPFTDLSSRFMVVPEMVMASGIRYPLLDSWSSTCDKFLENYGKFTWNAQKTKKHAKELAAGAPSQRDKMAAIHAFVRDEIRTLHLPGVGLDPDLHADKVLAERQTAYAEKAVLLQTMLDAVKIKSRLVWVADWRDGQIDPSVANPWWFEKVLVLVESDGQRLFLDPTDRSLGCGRLAPTNEGTQALIYHKRKPEIITLPVTPFDQNARRAEVDLSLDEEGRITGTGSLVLTGHEAWRRLRWKDDDEATVEAWEEWLTENFEGYDVSEIELEETLEEQRLRVGWSLAQREEEVLGDEASLSPSLPLGPIEQPFALPLRSRLTPVRLAFGYRNDVETTLSWPAGWDLHGLPKTTSFRNEAGLLAVGVQVDRENRTLRYTRRLDVTSTVFAPNEQYTAIRDLYGEAAKHDAQSLALVHR